MRTLSVEEMDTVAGGGNTFAQNFLGCAADTFTGAALGAGAGAITGAGAALTGIVGAILYNFASDACNALPSPY